MHGQTQRMPASGLRILSAMSSAYKRAINFRAWPDMLGFENGRRQVPDGHSIFAEVYAGAQKVYRGTSMTFQGR
jgi:hypothetical protein